MCSVYLVRFILVIHPKSFSYTTETASPWKPIFKYSICFAAMVTIIHCRDQQFYIVDIVNITEEVH